MRNSAFILLFLIYLFLFIADFLANLLLISPKIMIIDLWAFFAILGTAPLPKSQYLRVMKAVPAFLPTDQCL